MSHEAKKDLSKYFITLYVSKINFDPTLVAKDMLPPTWRHLIKSIKTIGNFRTYLPSTR